MDIEQQIVDQRDEDLQSEFSLQAIESKREVEEEFDFLLQTISRTNSKIAAD